MDIKDNKLLLLISIVAIILFAIVFSSNVSEVQDCGRSPRYMPNSSDARNYGARVVMHSAPTPILYRLILSPALLMIATVFGTYYFISRRLEEKLEKNMALISKLIDKNSPVTKENPEKVDNALVLKFFNANERKILETLIEKNGAALQSEISRMEGMNKLRTHRAIKEMERKGIIKTESHGKTNRVILAGNVKEILLKMK